MVKEKKYCALQPLFTSIWTRFIWLLCGSSEWGDGVSREFWLLSVWARLFSSKNYHCFQIFTMFLLLLCCIILVGNNEKGWPSLAEHFVVGTVVCILVRMKSFPRFWRNHSYCRNKWYLLWTGGLLVFIEKKQMSI